MLFKILVGIIGLIMSAAVKLPALPKTPSSLPTLSSSSRARDHHTPSVGTEDVTPKTKRPRDEKKVAFDAWLDSTECNLVDVSAQEVIDSVVEFARLTKRDLTQLEWVPSGMSKFLRSTQKQKAGATKQVEELKQGRDPSRWTITPKFSPTKPAKLGKHKVLLDKRQLKRLYDDRATLKVTFVNYPRDSISLTSTLTISGESWSHFGGEKQGRVDEGGRRRRGGAAGRKWHSRDVPEP
jgi:hypothetical protein